MTYADSEITRLAIGLLSREGTDSWQNYAAAVEMARRVENAVMPDFDKAYYMAIIEARLGRASKALH